MQRRSFLSGLSLLAMGTLPTLRSIAAPTSQQPPFPIIDSHIHLFDPTRPGGISWPLPGDSIYRPALPARYQAIAQPLGIVGAIAIEASPLLTDNDWVLHLVEQSPILLGMVGDLIPTAAEFPHQLARLHRNPFFLGIRHGNLWHRNLAADLPTPAFAQSMHLLQQAGLVLESANPDAPLLAALARVANRFPALTVVIDHLPSMAEPATPAALADFHAHLHTLGQAPNVYAKLSEIPIRQAGALLTDAAVYRPRLDRLWSAFGPGKLLFGSDWPNSDHVATYGETLSIVKTYLATKSSAEQHSVFFRNSQAAYRWKPRRANQQPPQPLPRLPQQPHRPHQP